MDYKTLGHRIRKLREALAMSQDLLALDSGLSKKTIWRIENGLIDPQLSSLTSITHALKTSVSDLCQGLE
jgi:DNA-binding XRE family transcriptional regulator